MLLLSDGTDGDPSNGLYSDYKKDRCHYAVGSRNLQRVGAAEIPQKKSYKSRGGGRDLTQYIQKAEFRVYAASDATI